MVEELGKVTLESPEKGKTFREAGIRSTRANDVATARKQFQLAVLHNPDDEVAWLHLAGLAASSEDAILALKKVQSINPDNPFLAKAQDWVTQTWPEAAQDDTSQNKTVFGVVDHWLQKFQALRRKPSVLATAGLLIILTILFATNSTVQSSTNQLASVIFPTPTNTLAQELDMLQQAVDEARAMEDGATMITILEQMYALAPYNHDVSSQLAELYYEQGIVLRNDRNFREAHIAFNQALAIQETLETAQLEQQQVTRYLEGVAHHQQGEWAEAAAVFADIYEQTPDYPYLDEILYSSYFNLGLTHQANERFKEALKAFENAAEVLPKVTEAQEKADEVALLLKPPTPTPTSAEAELAAAEAAENKRIVIDISEQHALVYEGEELVHEFIVSTGEPGRDTAIGEFEVQNKIDVAYASTWNLDMPYWLGIYYSGPLQNGFHAVPTIRHTGETMWDGYLGQRVSYGCVILSLADAEILYDWAEVGTKVKIQP